MMCLSSLRSISRSFLPLAILPIAGALSGCAFNGGSSSVAKTVSPGQAGLVLQGKTFGGEQPIVGTTLQLYAAGEPASGGGYGQGATALIPTANQPTSDSNGDFTITGLYTCPATPAVSQLYIVATGGSSGANGANPAIALMAGLGPCTASSTLNANSTIWINEVTTVATVFALQQFMAAPAAGNVGSPNIGAPGTAYNGVQTGIIGLQNAFGMINNLVNVSTGSAAVPTNAWATPETTKINTIADILVSCVNSSTSGTGCSTLFTDATPSGYTFKAQDTIQAAWYIAENSTNAMLTAYNTNLFKLISGVPPFPALTSQPNDYTIGVNLAPTYTSGTTTQYAMNTPFPLAIDAYGNVWLGSTGGVSVSSPAQTHAPGVTELSPSGSVIMNPVTSYMASTTGGSYSQFTTDPSSNTRNFVYSSSSTVPGAQPRSIAIDTNNNAWVTNYGDSSGTPAAGTVVEFNGSTGTGVAGSVKGGYYVGANPWGLAIDGHNNVFVSNTGPTGMDPLSIGKLVGSTGAYTYSTSGGTTPPQSIPSPQSITTLQPQMWSANLAIDTNTSAGTDGVVWVASPSCDNANTGYDNDAVVGWGAIDMFDAASLTALAGGETTSAYSNATVGAGSTTNCGTSTVPGTSLYIEQTPFSAAMSNPFGIAIDKNNGVWISDANDTGAGTSVGFNGLTYLTAPTSAAGTIPSSAWIVNGSFTPTSSPTLGQDLRQTSWLEVDGNNNVWAANYEFGTLGEAKVVTSGSAPVITFLDPQTTTGYFHTISNGASMAIDPSGNVWVANNGSGGTYTGSNGATIYIGNSLTVVVGAAAPVLTPLSQRVASNMLGQKP